MIDIGRLADRGPMTAAATAAALLAGSLLLSAFGPAASFLSLPLVIGSAAVVAFVVLRRGEGAALRAAGFCLVILVVLSLALSGSVAGLPLVALVLWLPAVVAAIVLRRTVRLDLAVLTVAACGLLTVVVAELAVGGGVDAWREVVASRLGDPARTGLTEAQFGAFVDMLAPRMSAATGMSVMLVALCALFLGRSWQAAAVRPGGFREEFHALALGRGAAVVCVVLVALAVAFDGTLWYGFAVVAVIAFCLQGLAVAHAVVARRGMAKGWLVGVYLMLFVSHTVLLLGALGLADNIVPLRERGAPPD